MRACEYIEMADAMAPGISSQHLTSWLREFDLACEYWGWQYPPREKDNLQWRTYEPVPTAYLRGLTPDEAVRLLMKGYGDFRNKAEQEDEKDEEEL